MKSQCTPFIPFLASKRFSYDVKPIVSITFKIFLSFSGFFARFALKATVELFVPIVLDEPIHPIGTPFPGSLEVIMENGVYYCPVKEANIDTPNSVCRLCIAEQLDF